MKIAIATDDRIHVSKHTGRAKEFVIITKEDDKVIDQFYIENKQESEHHHDHGHGHSHLDLVKELKENGVQLLLVHFLGKHFKENVISENLDFKIIKELTIEELLKQKF